MTINHAGILRKEYFTAYLKLIMNAYNIEVDQAKDTLFEHLFNNDSTSLGKQSYENFILAVKNM